MSEQAAVRFEAEPGLGRIVLARPERSNAFDLSAVAAFGRAIDAVEASEVSAVLLLGEGKRFCSGGDLVAIADSDNSADYIRELATSLEEQLMRLSRLDQPVVAGVHGAVAGAGLSFVLHADYVVAAQSTKFVLAYSALGLTPDCGVSYLLPRAIGFKRALGMALGSQVVTAATALEWGLVNEVVDDEQVVRRAGDIARALTSGTPESWANTKRLFWSSLRQGRTDSARDEAQTIGSLMAGSAASTRVGKYSSR